MRARPLAAPSTIARCAALLLVAACSREESASNPSSGPARDAAPRSARSELREQLLWDLATPRHAADGGGTATIETLGPGPVVAGGEGSFRILYRAGEHGIASGGALYLQVSPFWGWSAPQVESPGLPGFTRVSTDAPGVALAPRVVDRNLLEVRVSGRALAAGERVTLDYGAAEGRARVDDFAERDARFWIAVDGDGDGVRGLIADSPRVDVLPGSAAILSVVVTTVARPGGSARLCAALLDTAGNAGVAEGASLRFEGAPASLGLAADWVLDPARGARATFEIRPSEAGTFRWRAIARLADGRELAASVGPLVVTETGPRVLWADLHGHSGLSDGTGRPEDWWSYARDVAGLDAAALTDHDHWGLEFLDRDPARWQALVRLAREFDEPGRFVALPGYEFTDWIHGHRCVLWFGEDAELLSSLDARCDTPAKLRALLRGRSALSIPHHVAGGPIALDWDTAARTAEEREVEPLIEITSVHGVSESPQVERRIYAPAPGRFAIDALERGLEFGFVGSGDSHDGHPGLAHLGGHYPCSGLAGVVCEEPTREALLAALRSRRTFATTGPRILVRFSLAGKPMGGEVAAAEISGEAPFFVGVAGTAPVRAIELVGRGGVLVASPGDGSPDATLAGVLTGVRAGDFVYARVEQEDGASAWSSPVFVR